MKKVILISFLVCSMIGITLNAQAATSQTATSQAGANTSTGKYNAQIKEAIVKYKAKNYVGCIQDLTPIAKKDPSNAVVHYYLGNSYMKIGNKTSAVESFQKVITLNTTPALTAYAVQADACLNTNNMINCQYKKIEPNNIDAFVKDPAGYMQALDAKAAEAAATGLKTIDDKDEIGKLINGKYPQNMHPDATRTIINTQIQRERQEANSDQVRSDIPTDEEIAQAVKTLAKIGFNPYAAQQAYPYSNMGNEYDNLSMLYSNNQNNNNFMNMMPFIMQQSPAGNQQMSPEMMQAMMMSQMMPDFNFDTNKKY